MDDLTSYIQTRVQFSLDDQTVDALELTLEHLGRAPSRQMSWKWVILGMYTALHGSFGLVLRGGGGAQLLVPKQEARIYQQVNRERMNERPEASSSHEYVDWFLELYKKVQDPSRMRFLGGSPLKPTDSQSKSIETLNSCRGNLTHFSSTVFIIDVDVVLELLTDSVDIVDFLLNEAQSRVLIPWQLADRAKELIKALGVEIDATKNLYQLQGPTE